MALLLPQWFLIVFFRVKMGSMNSKTNLGLVMKWAEFILFYQKKLEVIYIGEALLFGRAFYSHFKPNGDKCEISDNWKVNPYAIVTIPVPEDRKYERSSLKRYLIQKLKPIDNTLEK